MLYKRCLWIFAAALIEAIVKFNSEEQIEMARKSKRVISQGLDKRQIHIIGKISKMQSTKNHEWEINYIQDAIRKYISIYRTITILSQFE